MHVRLGASDHWPTQLATTAIAQLSSLPSPPGATWVPSRHCSWRRTCLSTTQPGCTLPRTCSRHRRPPTTTGLPRVRVCVLASDCACVCDMAPAFHCYSQGALACTWHQHSRGLSPSLTVTIPPYFTCKHLASYSHPSRPLPPLHPTPTAQHLPFPAVALASESRVRLATLVRPGDSATLRSMPMRWPVPSIDSEVGGSGQVLMAERQMGRMSGVRMVRLVW